MTDQTTSPTVTPDPDRDGVILHLPEITYLDTQAWAVDVGLTTEGLAALRTLLAAYEASRTQTVERAPLRDRIAAAVHPLLMDTLPEVIAAARAREAADVVLAVLPAPVDQAALRETLRRVLAEADGFSYECLEPHDYQNHVDGVLAAVLPATTNHDTDTAPAATCSAQYHGPGEDRARLCIRAAQHQRTAHTDEHGFHWSDTVAMYPVADGTFRIGTDVRAELRRVADETAATDTQAHVCKPDAIAYYCPTSGETESNCHGGFDACCDRPDLHKPAAGAPQRSRAARYLDAFLHRGPGYDLTPDQPAAGARQDGAQP